MNIEHELIRYSAGNMYWKDANGVYMGCNQNMADIFGLRSPADVIGKTDKDLHPAGYDIDDIIKNDQQVMRLEKEEDEIKFEEIGRDQHGNQAWYITSKRALIDNGRVVGIQGTSTDITELKQSQLREKEALIQANEEIKQRHYAENLCRSIAIMAGQNVHDLRTPICTIGLSLSHLDDYLPGLISAYKQVHATELQDNPNKVRRLESVASGVNAAKRETKTMSKYITLTLKMLNRISTGVALAPEDLMTCSINRVVDEALKRYPFQENEKALVHVDNAMTFNFSGNSILTINNLFNLIKNSLEQIKKQGYGEIYITVKSSSSGNQLLFKDTAGGASPEIVARIFEGYRTTKQGGTGIGLSSCKMIMQSIGGDITCQSVEGEYIEFTLTFPVLSDNKAHTSLLKKSRSTD